MIRHKTSANGGIRRIIGVAAVFFLALTVPRAVHADTIYSNFGPGLTASGNAISVAGSNVGGEYYALSFVPTTPVKFTDVLTDLVLFGGQDVIGADLLADNAGLPGDSLLTLSQSSPIVNGIEEFTCSVSCPILQAGTQYWLQLKESDPDTAIGWYLSLADLSNGSDDALRYTFYDPNSGIFWPSGPRPVFEVDGVAISTVSEPSSLSLLFAGLGMLAGVTFYQRKQRRGSLFSGVFEKVKP